MYKVIFIDIDGTLKNSKRELTKRTKKAVEMVTNKGIKIVLCSGRPREKTVNTSKECSASNFVICCNGSYVYDYDKKVDIYYNSIDKKASKKLYDIAKISNTICRFETREKRVVSKEENEIEGTKERKYEVLNSSIEKFLNENKVVQITIVDEDYIKIRSIKENVENVENVSILNMHRSLVDDKYPKKGKIYYDIANSRSSKKTGIKNFCENFNIDIKDTIVIGDSQNDISMFMLDSYKVAMGNAIDKIKEISDEIIMTNDEDGVAIFLENLIK